MRERLAGHKTNQESEDQRDAARKRQPRLNAGR